ncbi:hypothetical protein CHS0354_026981 [Potamilus streckersoni]|uniref:FG-GAP repeat-containing protein n=1 Tax=Potamilus streckersoni TaxID=2493646 RepID=A0AAE0SCU1_9BIVA|nr:hypothetical protein CHS0354_026981 [Potamilus streckersoni]
MDQILTKLRRISRHHLILIGLCAVIGYLLRAKESYELRPVWRKRAEYHHFQNKKYPTLDEQLPHPVVTDLDSDGINEIVLISNDLKLSILALPNSTRKDEDDKTLPHIEVKHKVVIPQDEKSSTGRLSWPVVLITGYITPYLSMIQVRKQIVVIVTDDWWVMAFTSDLQLLWRQQLMNLGHNLTTYYIKSMGALITSHSVRKNDEGLVIVGGSYGHKHEQKAKTQEINGTSDIEKSNTAEESNMTHFSTFALNAMDGTVRWHHLPGEFEERLNEFEDYSDHHWKLSLKQHRFHVGESPWTYYKQELYKYMPHMWMSNQDTEFTLGRFQKKSVEILSGDEDDATMTPRSKSALHPEHIIGYAYGGQRPHSASEHIENPNVVVIRNQNGLEVLNLLTGRPLTRLQMQGGGAIYGPIDTDSDVKMVKWGEEEHYSPCFIDIFRIFPMKESLERFPVCYTQRMFFTTSWVYDEDMFKKFPPILIKSIAKKSGIVRHLLGHHLTQEETTYDFIVAGSMGRVSSFDKDGNINWQVQTPVNWADISLSFRRDKRKDVALEEEFLTSFAPDRKLISLPVYGKKDALVLDGWKDIAVVDLKEGRLLAVHTLPSPPTGPLVIADFNNDGLNDIIFTCKMGYIGFSLHKHTNHLYTFSYAVAVFLTILVIAWFLSPETHLSTDEEESEESD